VHFVIDSRVRYFLVKFRMIPPVKVLDFQLVKLLTSVNAGLNLVGCKLDITGRVDKRLTLDCITNLPCCMPPTLGLMECGEKILATIS
jgi:hypothetical protein